MMRGFAEGVVRRRRWVIAAWLLASVALAPQAARVERSLEVAARVRDSEAADVERELASRFQSPYARFAVLVASGIPSPGSPPGERVLREIISAVDSVTPVTGTFSYLDVRDTLFLGAADSGTFIIVGLDAAERLDGVVPALRAATERASARLRATHPRIALRWTGEVPINHDIRRTSADEARRAEQRVLPLTLVLLLLAFGAVVASLLPLAAGALAITITLGVAVVVNRWWPLSILLQNTVSMIGLGVGIDYALLTVSRFRESLAHGGNAESAAIETVRHAGSAIALSGLTVMIGFGALLLVPLNELQAVGIGGIVVVGTSALLAVTLLPGLLAWLGPRVELGRVGRRRAGGSPIEHRWRAWGRWVVAHPVLVLLVAGTPVVLLAWEARRLYPELPRGNWLPPTMESARAAQDLADMRRDGVVNSLRVLLDLPQGATLLDSTGWMATRRLGAAIAADPRVGRVRSLTTVIPTERPNLMMYSLLSATARNALVTPDGRAAVIEVVPAQGAGFNELTQLSRDLRKLDVGRLTGAPGTELRVGGMPAFNADYIDTIRDRTAVVVFLVVALTLVALMVGFGSVLIPLKALALNLLSVAAAFGAVVLVFQDGYGGRWLGLDGPLHGVFPAVPILVFCIVFGLSMDYEVFLVARVAEARRRLGEADAIVEGLARTGGVITSAAAIMIVVFGAFMLGDFLFIKVLGFALVVAVLLDATLVRIAIGPALLRLAGKWNWWPGRTSERESG